MANGNGKADEELEDVVRYRPPPEAPPAKPPDKADPSVTADSAVHIPPALEGQTTYCPGCQKERPIEEFHGAQLTYDASAPRCKPCRDQGPPPDEPEAMQTLTMTQRRILKAVLTTGNYAEAARQAGCSAVYVRNLMKGHGDHSADFRRAFRQLLETEGLDYGSIASMSKLLFHSVEPKWNPKKECWDFFPDNRTRLGILRHLTKLREIDPPTMNNFTPQAPVVHIHTNVHGEAEPTSPPGTFEIEDGEIISVPVIEEEAGGVS